MKESRKSRRRKSQHEMANILLTSGPIADYAQAQMSMDVDAAADREWLRAHPNKICRVRPASIREVVAFNLLPGSKTAVVRGPDGSQVRAFMDPPLAADGVGPTCGNN